MLLKDRELLKAHCYINGEWVSADDRQTVQVRNPATEELICTVPVAGAAETKRAIDAAHDAFAPWKALTAESRSRVLRRWFDLLIEHQEDLATLMTSEQGKPLSEARGEISYAAAYIEWYAEEGKRIYGDLLPSPWEDRSLLVKKEPIGVCAAITPWNFPAAMIARKVAPALAAGCTMVVKPATQTPLSALALAELASRAGVPAGVLNVVTGDARTIGAELTRDARVRKLSFTGSTEVGRLLAAQCAPTLKKLSLELGGNAPFIVFDDADLDSAVVGAIASKYRNSGQTCVCANRLYVQEGVYDAFVEKLCIAVNNLRVGDGMKDGVTQGPLIDAAALEKVSSLVEDAVSQGARVAAGGSRHSLGGTFYEPTVLAGVTSSMRISREEIFGPVAPVIKFRSEREAVELANDSEFGLAAYFFSRDLARVWRVSSAIESGIVGVNTGAVSTAVAPFGGVKQSGYGREGSKYGIEDYVQTKYICLGGLAA